jgi:hypothetical protein
LGRTEERKPPPPSAMPAALWEVVFRENDKNFALLLRDNVLLDVGWLTGVNQNLNNLSERAAASRTILVANKKIIPKNSMVAAEGIERFLVEGDPIVAAEMAFETLSERSSSPSSEHA